MTIQLAPPRRFVKAYHRHHHLLLQFIWSELILAHQAVVLAKQALDDTHIDNDGEDSQLLLNTLTKQITRLAGSAQEYMRLFAGDDDGIINKLKNYCILFSLQDPIGQKVHGTMIQEASKAWLYSVQALAIIRTLSQQAYSPNIAQTTKLPAYLDKIHRCLIRLVHLTGRIAAQFQTNENVVFFLVRNQKAIDALYNEGFVLSLLYKMFQKKISNVREFLVRRYTERGFEHLVPFINASVDQLVS